MINTNDNVTDLLTFLNTDQAFHDPRDLPAYIHIQHLSDCIKNRWVELQRLVSYDVLFQSDDDGDQWEHVPPIHLNATLLRGLRCTSNLSQARLHITTLGQAVLPILPMTPPSTLELCAGYIDAHPGADSKKVTVHAIQ